MSSNEKDLVHGYHYVLARFQTTSEDNIDLSFDMLEQTNVQTPVPRNM